MTEVTVMPYPELARITGGHWRRAEAHVALVDLPVVILTDGTDLVIRADHDAQVPYLDMLRAQVGAALVHRLEPVTSAGRLLRRALDVLARIQHGGGDLLTGPACPLCGHGPGDGHAEDCEVGDVLTDLMAEVAA